MNDTFLSSMPPQAGVAQMQRPSQYSLKGDLALSLSLHQGDFAGARILLDVIELLEPMKHVDVVLSIMGGVETLDDREWYDFHQKALGIFRKVYLNKVRAVSSAGAYGPSRDWRPNNMMFRSVADYFATLAYHKGKDKHGQIVDNPNAPYIGAFYYLEPDVALLKKNWFTQLTAEYQASHKPFMGCIRNTARLVANNRQLPPHMNGSGIYPNPLLGPQGAFAYDGRALLAAAMNQHPEAAPFDVLAGPSVTPHCKNTKLIYVEFGNVPNFPQEAVVWHGDKQYQTNLTTIERLTGVSPERPHFQQEPSVDLQQMGERVMGSVQALPGSSPFEFEQPTVARALTGMPDNVFVPTSESLRAKAARILAQAEAREVQEKAEAATQMLAQNQMVNTPLHPENGVLISHQKPRKPDEAYRAIISEVGYDALAMARTIKWVKSQQKKERIATAKKGKKPELAEVGA